jgi:hypothetical protein
MGGVMRRRMIDMGAAIGRGGAVAMSGDYAD